MGNQQTSNPHGMKNPRLKATVLVVVIIFAGVLFTWWTAVRADREMRADLLQQARLVAKAVNIARIQALSGTTADIKSPDYQRLKEQLTDVRSANPQCRFFYLIGRKAGGAVFFFVDSEPEGSENYSPPGQVYKNAHAGYRRVFDTDTEAVEGPVTDQQGTWISALIPITDTATASSDLVTENEAQAMVLKAVDFYKKNGRRSLLKELNNPRGKFRKGELYVFAYNREMTMQAHPVKPELVGQNLLYKKDWAGGKYFRKEMQKVALSRGSGWVDYQYENPVNKKILPKTTYVQKVDDLIICAGAYKSTGQLLAVLGMEIDACTWKWNVTARSALPMGIILVLLIGASAIFAATRTVYHEGTSRGIDASQKPGLRRLLLAIAIPSLMVVAVLIGGGWFYGEQRQAIRKQVEEQLNSILRLKVNQITAWREKQIQEATLLSKSRFFVREATSLLADPKAEGTKELRDFLRLSQSHSDYEDIILVNPKGQVRLRLNESLKRIYSEDTVALDAALRKHKPVHIDLHICETNSKVCIGEVVPLFFGNGQAKTPLGAVILVSDPGKFLYPLLQSWPILSKTAETLLVRRDGDNVLFLNELRHQHGTALKLRIPLTKTDVPAVMAVLGRKGGMEQSKDYCGIDVVSVFQSVPDSPWFIVAKIDAAEVFANWQLRAGTILSLIISLIILVGALGFILWQRGEKVLYDALRQSKESLQKSEQLLSATLRSIGDGVITCDTEGNIISLNTAAEKLTGRSSDEAIGRPIVEIFHTIHSETRQEAENLVGRALRENRVIEMAAHTALIARDGAEFQIADSCAPIHDAAGSIIGAVLVFRDISEEYHQREQMERRHNLSYELLGILNSSLALPDTLNSVVSAVKRWTGFDAVGIRLQAGDDFPYFARNGFSDDFLLAENTLVEHGKDGGLCRDKDGNVTLQCTCGLVISGKTDPANPLFTPGGSFWTNNSFSLLELPSGQDPRLYPRNRCMHEGYGSLALIPIFENQKIVGLLQLNNRRIDSLTLDTINFFELLSANIGETLMRKKAEWALKERFKELNCLYGISALIELPDISSEELLKKTVYLLPPAWQFPEITEARITLDGQTFQTEHFRETPWMQTEKIIVNGKPTGQVEVCYTEERPLSDEGPFLIEERQLIEAIAQRLGRVIERDRAEEALFESEERYHFIADHTADHIWTMDLSLRYMYSSPAVTRLLGYTIDEFMAQSIDQFFTPESLVGAKKVLVGELETDKNPNADPNRIRTFQSEHRHKNGTLVWLESSITMIRDASMKPIGILGVSRDITERKKAEEQLQHLATHDFLTDLPSLKLARDRMSVAFNMARRYKKSTAVMFIDLDGFKDVNDTLGHDAGDYVLQQVAQRMLSCVRDTDTVARVGGDEFLIIATEINAPDNAAQIAEKVIQMLSQPVIFKEQQTVVGASIGIALFPEHGKDMDQLIKQADKAMYRAKNTGKNGFRFVNTAMK
jgi:diguanylate cyclase (GGDEF)-like protein/PAS domain S-box-containing protein